MTQRSEQAQDGFMALVAVIIISATFLILITIVSRASFYNRFNVLDYEYKKVSASLAEACTETVMVNLARTSSYVPVSASGDQIVVDSASSGKTCRICAVTTSGSNKTIVTRAVYKGAYTNLTTVVTPGSTDFTVGSWDEQGSYSGGCVVP
jgi:cellobiose-specific phosphotransferase system component IIC